MTTVTITDIGYRHEVRFPYDPNAVELVKTAVPPHARDWNPAERCWLVDDYYVDALAKALRRNGHRVRRADGTPPPPPRQEPTPWAAALFAAVGTERHDTVFRALSRVLHPDTPTGDTALMHDLLEAREAALAAHHNAAS